MSNLEEFEDYTEGVCIECGEILIRENCEETFYCCNCDITYWMDELI